jgi:hypothetical protein
MKTYIKNKLGLLGFSCLLLFSSFASAGPQDGSFEIVDRELRLYGSSAARQFSILLEQLTPSEILGMKRSLDGGHGHTIEIQNGRLGPQITLRSARSIGIIPGKGHSLEILADYVHSSEALIIELNGGVALTGPVADGLKLAVDRGQKNARFSCEFVKLKSPVYPGQGFNACQIFP